MATQSLRSKWNNNDQREKGDPMKDLPLLSTLSCAATRGLDLLPLFSRGPGILIASRAIGNHENALIPLEGERLENPALV